ncbi:hypothetical protein [Nitrincola sp. MINF-07-Sa-05]|uniref:hypothetical protein n=1 Tax=Nitrincola salilacus TaxID=3400273 RepID=UPI0039185603
MIQRGLLLGSLLLLSACGSDPIIPPAQADALSRVLEVERIALLPEVVIETSGLARHHDRLWTINDSGNLPLLYRLSEDGREIDRRIRPLDAANVDWEALAQDEQYLHILDCGNNRGNRNWLQLYSVRWQDIDGAPDGANVPAKRVNFRFADAERIVSRHNHDNDCEAAAVVDGKIWVFTKNWADTHTRHYILDPDSPDQELVSQGRYPVHGLITAADYDAETGMLALLGYTVRRFSSRAFLWTLPVIDGAIDWSVAQYHVVEPPGQWEAVLWQQGDLLLTSERSILGDTQLGIIRMAATRVGSLPER